MRYDQLTLRTTPTLVFAKRRRLLPTKRCPSAGFTIFAKSNIAGESSRRTAGFATTSQAVESSRRTAVFQRWLGQPGHFPATPWRSFFAKTALAYRLNPAHMDR